ncbi:tetratricopeptide repeat protein [Janthinobacterium fluminis]|uniref:Tetratricopeptide repeat protein n=1 Tax=Janthinobacterium fluminis TaxID=2987524 RepID=A0ABT5K1Z0_9BURK|nr:tetratricopeptide repeat protein [Janthinobacterium fluminis]MDC8758413.1 tetratricopeptide repeat protein [Janthinobacterium fluminis]
MNTDNIKRGTDTEQAGDTAESSATLSDAERIRALRKRGQHQAAKKLAEETARLKPQDAELQYEAACVHDYLGLGAAAIPFYQAALAGILPEALQRGAYLGLCSSYRARGRYDEALALINEALSRFPDASALKVFRAIVLYNLQDNKQAMATLLEVLVQTAIDPEIREYERAILLYAKDLDRQWF